MQSIQVLLSSYNGEQYLQEQLDSIMRQKNVTLGLLVRDDGSSDITCDILTQYEMHNQNINVIKSSNIGAVKSFLDLIVMSGGYDFYAFADQDDVWDEDKLEIAIQQLSDYDEIPAMYYSNLRVVDKSLNVISNKMHTDIRALDLEEILLGKNNATGCTMVINRNLMQLLKQYYPNKVIMHDSWIYAVCKSVNGKIIYDETPRMSYRQHMNNVLGARMNLKKRFLCSSFGNNKGIRSTIAREILEGYADNLNEYNKSILELFAYGQNTFKGKFEFLMKMLPKVKTIDKKIILLINVILGLL